MSSPLNNNQSQTRRFTCKICSKPKSVSRMNYFRHNRTHHLLCPHCLSIESKCKHACFGSRLLSRSQMLRMNNDPDPLAPPTSSIFIPMEMRTDCLAAFQTILAARDLLDNDIYSVAFYLLARLKRSCLACMGSTVNSGFLKDYHTCQLHIKDIMENISETVFCLFNVRSDEKSYAFLSSFLAENTHG